MVECVNTSSAFPAALLPSPFPSPRSRPPLPSTIWKSAFPLSCSQPHTLSAPSAFAPTISLPSSPYPPYHRLLPCPHHTTIPPRVEHLVVLQGGPVAEYISKAAHLPPLYVADLIHFGAVYYALVCPKPPLTATADQLTLYQQFTSPEALKGRASLEGKAVQEAQNTFRITRVDEYVEPGTYLRVYVHPRRFPRCYEVDWMSRILAVTESYVLLDKPSGISVGGTSNNIEECCATFATRALGLTTPLKTTHQIDNCTEGCVVLARTKEFCSNFHRKIREKTVKKLYLALVAAPMPLGLVTHYMQPCKLAPRLVSEGSHVWLLFGYLLLTANIRAQLAACGAPIVGDSMYMPASLAERINPGVNPFGNHRKQYENDDDEITAVENWIAQHGKEPKIAIGLQACQISWDDGEHIYRAGDPWWR